jgi:ABC-type multidrug transport system ATPase subunit
MAVTPDNAYAIELQELTRRFGDFTAVDHLSFRVRRGSIFGFLGSNGSGKSTCIRMLCGLLEPSSGTALVNGHDIRRDPEGVKRSIGYMNQAFSLYRDLTVSENLEFFGGIYGLRGAALRSRKAEVIELVGIGNYADRRSGQLSGGWKQRLALATALIHEPEIIFLDEPTAGIDPVARRDLWDLLFTLAAGGKTLFVTTHYMDEAERCDELIYISAGKLIVQGTPADLKLMPQVSPPDTRRVAIATPHPAQALAALKAQPFSLDATLVESEIHLLTPTSTGEDTIISVLTEAGLPAPRLRPIEPSLEDVFVTLTRALLKEEETHAKG